MTQVATSGSFKPGRSGNPSGRPSSHSRVQLFFLRYAEEAGEMMVDIARGNGGKDAAVRLAACNAILDRAVGRPKQSLEMDLGVKEMIGERKLSDLSDDELCELRRRVAMTVTAAPAIIEATAEPAPTATQLDMLGEAE